MKKFVLTLFWILATASVGFCATTNSYDKYGSKTGSYKQTSSGYNSYNKYGNKTGSFKTDSTGRITQYDKHRNKVKSYK